MKQTLIIKAKTEDGIMEKAMLDAGFEQQGNKFIVPEGRDVVESLETVVADLDMQQSLNQGSYSQSDKTLSKTIGTMPSANIDTSGFSNWFNLLLFLSIDVVAIIVGIYLLMK